MVVCANSGTVPSSCPVGCVCVNTTDVSCKEVTRAFSHLPATTRSLEVLNTSSPDVIADISAFKVSGLTELTLRNCLIRDIKSGHFMNLSRLTRLNLSSNLLTNLPDGVFTQLNSLQVLNLSRNFISNVSNQWLKDVHNLKVLDMSSNNISNLKDDVFACLPTLQRLSLSENHISVVLPSALSGMNNSLRCLDLSFNRISCLNNGVFSGLQSLRLLNLAGNNLESLKGDCFHGLTSLQELDVSANHISSLDDGAFSELNNLQRLNLSGNRLHALGDQCFRGLLHLQQLDVSRNRISSVSPGTFQSMGSLMELILADNPVLGRLQQELMVLVGTGRRLQTVDVSRSGLTQVPAALTRSIRTLQLAGNAVTTIRCGDLDSYPLLQLLNLADNQLEELEEDALGRLEVLSTLYLSGNHLLIIPRSLPAGLITLHLQRNRIQQLNSSDLQGLPRLKHLSLRCSGITVIQNGAFSQLTALETLDISENPLKSLPGNALSGPLMTVLRLSHLGGILSSASDTKEMTFPVTSPERLEVLELDSSPALAQQLLADTAALAAFRQLRELNLINTGLTNLRSDLFHFLPRLRTLRLNGNQWECEGMFWLANWIHQQQKHQKQELETSLQGAYCASPPQLASTPIIQLHDADFNITTNNNGSSTSTVFSMPVESNVYEATTEARYDASVTRKTFSVFRIHNTQVPDNETLSTEDPLDKKTLSTEDPLDKKSQHRSFTIHPAPSIGPFTDINRSTTIPNRDEMSPTKAVSTIPTTTPHKSSSNANNAYTISSTLTVSEELIFNTTVAEGDLITNIYSTDSSVTNISPDNDVDIKSVSNIDITTSGAFLVTQVPNSSNAPAPNKTQTVTSSNGASTKQTKMSPAIPNVKPHVKVMNTTVNDEIHLFTDKNSLQGTQKSSHHIESVTTIENQNISSKTVIKFLDTNITSFETLKTYINNPSNSTKTLFINKSWAQHKFFPNSKNKNFLPNNGPFQSAHNNSNIYKVISNPIKNDTLLQQDFSNKDPPKFKHYQDKSLNHTMQDENLNAESEENITSHNNSAMEASIFNKTSENYNYGSSDFRNQSANQTAHNMKFGYHTVMKHNYTNMSTNHSIPNSKTQLQIPLYSSVHNSVHRNHSTKIPTGLYTNKLKLADRNNSENFGKVEPQGRKETSSDVTYSGNISYIKMQDKSDSSTGNTANITSPLEGQNLVFENVTIATRDTSVFYSSRASDTISSGAHITVKENISTSLVSSSHPSMFVLLGVGLAMAVAFAMAMSHCANRRRHQAVEYSRQQDIEVRSMSSIGDLW